MILFCDKSNKMWLCYKEFGINSGNCSSCSINTVTIDNDIALLKVSTVPYNNYIQPICRADTSFHLRKDAVECFASGWGHIRGGECIMSMHSNNGRARARVVLQGGFCCLSRLWKNKIDKLFSEEILEIRMS